MDRKLEKKPWHWRYKYYLALGACVIALLVFAIVFSLGPKRTRIDSDFVKIAETEDGKFMEYVDVEGIVYPILTIKVNANEAGFVDRVVAEDGSMLHAGDTILVLRNPELMRTIDDEEDEWLNQQRLYREQVIEMEQKSLTLQQQALDADYEMSNLDNKLKLAHEEYGMGMKSKAEIDLAESEYEYHRKKTELQMRSLSHDSAATALRREMLQADISRAQTKRDRAAKRYDNLVVRAPIEGQLSFVTVAPGEQVQSGQSIGELKVLSDYKLHVSLNEYYVDRITTGLPGNITQQNEHYPLRLSRVVPEIKDRNFEADLVFTGERPANLRVGKSYRVQIELGQPESALVIPRGDFYNATGGRWIYRLTDDGSKAVKTEISIGRQNPRQYEVLSGLKPGVKVIVNGYDKLHDSEMIILE